MTDKLMQGSSQEDLAAGMQKLERLRKQFITFLRRKEEETHRRMDESGEGSVIADGGDLDAGGATDWLS